MPWSEDAKTKDVMLVVLRVGAGLLFMQHGAQKLFGLLGAESTVPLFSQMGLAGVLEFFGGLAVVAGVYARGVAAVLALEMLIAYFQAHFPRGFWPIQNGGERALLFMLVWLYVAARGAGGFTLDALWRRRRGGGFEMTRRRERG